MGGPGLFLKTPKSGYCGGPRLGGGQFNMAGAPFWGRGPQGPKKKSLGGAGARPLSFKKGGFTPGGGGL